MKTKLVLLLMLAIAIILCIACKKEHVNDYRIMSKWYGSYKCVKYGNYSFYKDDTLDVIVDILPTNGDSMVYVREHTTYDLNEDFLLEVKSNAKIDVDGYFDGYTWLFNWNRNCYVAGNIYDDSLKIKMYSDYETKPTIPDDSINIGIIRYIGVRIK
jgi:hypothetical protein